MDVWVTGPEAKVRVRTGLDQAVGTGIVGLPLAFTGGGCTDLVFRAVEK